MRLKILHVDDDQSITRSLARWLPDCDLQQAENFEDACDILLSQSLDVIITDSLVPGRGGKELLLLASVFQPEAERIMLCATPPIDLDQLLKDEVLHHFFAKPWDSQFIQFIEKLHQRS